MAPSQPVAFSLADVGFSLKILGHVTRTSAPDISPATFTRFLTANSNKERVASIVTPFAVDPYVLQRVVHSIEGDYEFLGDSVFVPRDFDLWMRCATELRHRGDEVPILFDKWFQGSALNAQPEMYGGCPFGKWETFRLQEPHLMSKDKYPAQVADMERIIDEYMAPRLGKVEEIGKMLRLLIWDLYCYTSYGEGPNEETAQLLQMFEDHSPEFDYAVRMCTQKIPYEWSNKLKAEIWGMGDWCWRVTMDRKRNIDKHADKNDVLTDMILSHPEMDIAKMEGALRGVFTGGMNNCHSAVCGTLISNAQNGDNVYKYMQEDSENIQRIFRESLRLFTAIPTSRSVREEDNFVVDGKRLKPGTGVVLATYAINTDPRSWEDPLEYNPKRFENTSELGFMCQKGFAPLGAAAELGGRPCGARFHDAHMLSTIIGKLLRDYKFTPEGRGFFEMKQSAGTSMYAGHCKMRVTKR